MNAPDRDEQRQQEEDERQQSQERQKAALPADLQTGDEEAINSPVIINR